MRHFLKQALTDFKSTGSVSPSSKQLAKAMVETADIKNKQVIVEFGSGTGVFTEQILKSKSADALYFAIELNPYFVAQTQKKFPTAKIYNDSASNLALYLKENGVEQCDCIISGLPFANFNESLQGEILATAVNSLVKGGVFVTFTYNMSVFTKSGNSFRKKLPEYFETVTKTKTIWGNLPPAFIFHAVNKPRDAVLNNSAVPSALWYGDGIPLKKAVNDQ